MAVEEKRQRDKHCPECRSKEIEFDEIYGFYRCKKCEHCWGYPEDDPDYDELQDDLDQDQLYDGLDVN